VRFESLPQTGKSLHRLAYSVPQYGHGELQALWWLHRSSPGSVADSPTLARGCCDSWRPGSTRAPGLYQAVSDESCWQL